MEKRTIKLRNISAVAGPIALGALSVTLSLLAAVAVEAQPRSSSRLAAVFPPWWSPSQVVGAAAHAGEISGVGAVSFIVILRGDPTNLAEQASAAGAVLLLDPALAGACAPAISVPKP